MYSCLLMALLAFLQFASMIHAIPVVSLTSFDEDISFKGIAGVFNRKPPNFSCGFWGVYCYYGPADGAKNAAIITHVLGRKLLQSSCSIPGIHCAFTDADGAVTVADSSLQRRKVAPWSSCGFPGITCATTVPDDIAPSDATDESTVDIEGRDTAPDMFCAVKSSDGTTSVEGHDVGRKMDHPTNCELPHKTLAGEEKVKFDRDIPMAPSTLATFGMPVPTYT